MLTCNFCRKQCVGQRDDIFWNRWSNCKGDTRKYEEGNSVCKGICFGTLTRHLSFLHLPVKLIDETDPSCPTKREDYCIDQSNHGTEL